MPIYKVRQRQRHHAAQMQAVVDGCDVPPGAGPPLWFAVWNVRHQVATTLAVERSAFASCAHMLMCARTAWGDHFAGPFATRQEAQDVAVESFAAALRRR